MFVTRRAYSVVTDDSAKLTADMHQWARMGRLDVEVHDQQATVLVYVLPEDELTFKRDWSEFKPT